MKEPIIYFIKRRDDDRDLDDDFGDDALDDLDNRKF
jgi:hypothetical protein